MKELLEQYKRATQEYNNGFSLFQANDFVKAAKSLEEAKNLFQTILQTPIPTQYAEKFKVVNEHLLKAYELLLRSQYKLSDAKFEEIQKGFIKLIRQIVHTGGNTAQTMQKVFQLIQSCINCKAKAYKSSQQQVLYTTQEAFKEDQYEPYRLTFLKLELRAIEESNAQDVLFKENVAVLQRLTELSEKKSPNTPEVLLYKTKRVLLFLHSYSGTTSVSDSQMLKELEEVRSQFWRFNNSDTALAKAIPFVSSLITSFVSFMRYLERQPSNIDELLSVSAGNETLTLKNRDIFTKILKTVFCDHLESVGKLLQDVSCNLDITDLFDIFNKRDLIYTFYIMGSLVQCCAVYGFREVIMNIRKMFAKPLPSKADPDLVKQYNNTIAMLNSHSLQMNDQPFVRNHMEKLDIFQQLEYKRRFECKNRKEFLDLSIDIAEKIARHPQEDFNSIAKFNYINCKSAMKYDIQTAYNCLVTSMKMRGMLEKEKKAEAKLIDTITKKSTKSDLKSSFSLMNHFEHSFYILLHYQQMVRIHELKGNFASCETCIRQGLRFSIFVKSYSFTLLFLYHLARLKLNRHDFDDVEYLLGVVKYLLGANRNTQSYSLINRFSYEFILLESMMLMMQNKNDEAERILQSAPASATSDIGIELQKAVLNVKKNDIKTAKIILEKLSKIVELEDKRREESLWVQYYCNALDGDNKLNYDFVSNFGLAWNDVPIPLKKKILSHIKEDNIHGEAKEREYAFLSSMSMGIRLKHTLQDLLDCLNTPISSSSSQSQNTMTDDGSDVNRGVEKMMKRLSIVNDDLQLSTMIDLKDITTKKSFIDDLTSILPSNITACNICISDDYSSLVVTVLNNQRGKENCIVMPIPLVKDEESFTKMNRLFNESVIRQTQMQYQKSSNSDIQLSSSTLSSYSNYQSYQALFGCDNNILHKVLLSFDHLQILSKESFNITERESWWRTRKELDEKLATLIKYVEDLLFGPIKLLLIPSMMNEFDTMLEECSEFFIDKLRDLLGQSNFDSRIAKLILKSFSAFREEVDFVESIRYFLLENASSYEPSLMLSIQQLFYSTFLQAFSERKGGKDLLFRHCTRVEKQKIKRKHMVLCLDKLIQQLPLETMPTIRHMSTSRMPSMLLLYYHLNRMTELNGEVKRNNVYYLLNPGGDLSNSEVLFKPIFEKQQNWKGKVGSSPPEEELYQAFSENDLMIYIGHGTGEKYYNPHKIRRLNRCCPILLMGCSSGRLKEYGNYEPNGTVLSFLLAGSPFVIANLWDVTDKDIDRLTEHIISKWLCNEESQSICEILAKARDTCVLSSLIGSATVCYGLPDVMIN